MGASGHWWEARGCGGACVMVVILKLTLKICSFDIVSRRLWFSVAMWETEKSDIKGWSVERRVGGVRLITPLIGLGFCLKVGDDQGSESVS